MKTRELIKNNTPLVRNVFIADSFFTRGIGLLGRGALGADTGMLITPCRSVHTLMMRFSLDLIFLSDELEVLGAKWNVRPFRMVSAPKDCVSILELESGWFSSDLVAIGDRWELSVH